MSGVIYSKMNEQSKKMDKFEAKLDRYVEIVSNDLWKRSEQEAYARFIVEHFKEDQVKFKELSERINSLEKQFIRYHTEGN